MTTPQIYNDHNSYYLIQDIQGLDRYQRAKAISNFVTKGTKLLEMYLDSEIEKIFADNFILIRNNDKESIKRAFRELRQRGKQIEILDLFSGKEFYKCEYITTTKGKMTVVIEEDKYLEAGIRVNESEVKA